MMKVMIAMVAMMTRQDDGLPMVVGDDDDDDDDMMMRISRARPRFRLRR